DNNYNLKITNEAMETHYINKFEIVVAEHPLGTELYPAIDNSLLLFSEIINASAISKDGKDITNLLQHDDNKFYRSGVEKVSELKKGTLSDWIEIKIPAVKNSPSKMLLKYRNTLLSTTLLYNVVIGSQGAGGLAWTKKMNEDAQYASQFKMIYEAFSGVKLTVFEDGIWKTCGKFKDAGPLSWKYLAAKLPPVKSDTLLIRLEFIPDNFMIDYVAFDITSSVDKITASIVYPCGIMDGSGTRIDSLLNYIKDDDTQYLKTEPGDSYCLNYRIPAVKSCESTVLIYSKGYYNEWIRGGWISSKDNYTFNLFDIEGTLSELADSWIENSELLESEFFQSRFSLREEK
ncbi:MAG TPA: hypothetical protein VMT35_06595, partial [Ignavibacteriaceae bacterium]|nr:hypothetical protein [Ignavibacteriaceae bacterium]